MDIKEIAKKLAPDYWKRDQWNIEYFDSVGFAEALIESYKAELLDEVGEPVAEVIRKFSYKGDFETAVVRWEGEIPHHGVDLYTSDQVAAAIEKATKPLEEEIERLKSEQTELIDRFQNENCGRVHMGEPVISQSMLDIRANENVAIDIDQLVKIAQGNLQEEAAQYKDELAMVLRCSADLRSQLAAAQEETRLLTERNATNEEYAANLVKALTKTQDQLAKAEQLWQIAQGRCDGLEEKLAKAEQRVAEACALAIYSECNSYSEVSQAIIRSGEWRKFVKEV